MTPKEAFEIAQAIKECQMSGFEAEIMRARVAGRILKVIALHIPTIEADRFFDECGLRTSQPGPASSNRPYLFSRKGTTQDK